MAWLGFTLIYIIMVGSAAITVKLSLRHVSWQVLLVPTALIYLLFVVVSAAQGTLKASGPAIQWMPFVVVTGIFTAGSFAALSVALQHADASRVVPISATYPLVTAILGMIVLSERITLTRIVAIVLIVSGGVLIAR